MTSGPRLIDRLEIGEELHRLAGIEFVRAAIDPRDRGLRVVVEVRGEPGDPDDEERARRFEARVGRQQAAFRHARERWAEVLETGPIAEGGRYYVTHRYRPLSDRLYHEGRLKPGEFAAVTDAVLDAVEGLVKADGGGHGALTKEKILFGARDGGDVVLTNPATVSNPASVADDLRGLGEILQQAGPPNEAWEQYAADLRASGGERAIGTLQQARERRPAAATESTMARLGDDPPPSPWLKWLVAASVVGAIVTALALMLMPRSDPKVELVWQLIASSRGFDDDGLAGPLAVFDGENGSLQPLLRGTRLAEPSVVEAAGRLEARASSLRERMTGEERDDPGRVLDSANPGVEDRARRLFESSGVEPDDQRAFDSLADAATETAKQMEPLLDWLGALLGAADSYDLASSDLDLPALERAVEVLRLQESPAKLVNRLSADPVPAADVERLLRLHAAGTPQVPATWDVPEDDGTVSALVLREAFRRVVEAVRLRAGLIAAGKEDGWHPEVVQGIERRRDQILTKLSDYRLRGARLTDLDTALRTAFDDDGLDVLDPWKPIEREDLVTRVQENLEEPLRRFREDVEPFVSAEDDLVDLFRGLPDDEEQRSEELAARLVNEWDRNADRILRERDRSGEREAIGTFIGEVVDIASGALDELEGSSLPGLRERISGIRDKLGEDSGWQQWIDEEQTSAGDAIDEVREVLRLARDIEHAAKATLALSEPEDRRFVAEVVRVEFEGGAGEETEADINASEPSWEMAGRAAALAKALEDRRSALTEASKWLDSTRHDASAADEGPWVAALDEEEFRETTEVPEGPELPRLEGREQVVKWLRVASGLRASDTTPAMDALKEVDAALVEVSDEDPVPARIIDLAIPKVVDVLDNVLDETPKEQAEWLQGSRRLLEASDRERRTRERRWIHKRWVEIVDRSIDRGTPPWRDDDPVLELVTESADASWPPDLASRRERLDRVQTWWTDAESESQRVRDELNELPDGDPLRKALDDFTERSETRRYPPEEAAGRSVTRTNPHAANAGSGPPRVTFAIDGPSGKAELGFVGLEIPGGEASDLLWVLEAELSFEQYAAMGGEYAAWFTELFGDPPGLFPSKPWPWPLDESHPAFGMDPRDASRTMKDWGLRLPTDDEFAAIKERVGGPREDPPAPDDFRSFMNEAKRTRDESGQLEYPKLFEGNESREFLPRWFSYGWLEYTPPSEGDGDDGSPFEPLPGTEVPSIRGIGSGVDEWVHDPIATQDADGTAVYHGADDHPNLETGSTRESGPTGPTFAGRRWRQEEREAYVDVGIRAVFVAPELEATDWTEEIREILRKAAATWIKESAGTGS